MDRFVSTALVPILLALAGGDRLSQGFHVAYKATRRNTGFAKIRPWLQRAGASIAAIVIGAPSALVAHVLSFLRARPNMVAATLMLALTCADVVRIDAAAGLALIAVTGTVNVAQLERDLLKVSGEAATLLENTMKECQAFENKDKDGKVLSTGRLMTVEEKNAIQALIEKGNAIRQTMDRAKGDSNMSAEIARLTAGMTPERKIVGAPTQTVDRRSLGQQIVESVMFKFARGKAAQKATGWTSDSEEFFAPIHAATLTEDGASGGDLIVTEYRPGILQLLFKRLVVADLIAPGTTDSNSITYMKEETFTNAAAAVAEGAPKPESALIFNQVNDLVKKIAHWLPVTDEMLEDVAQIRSYIDARLNLGLDLAEEDQLLNGDGTGQNLTGLLNRSGLTTAEVRSGSVTNAEAIFIEMMKVFNASFVMPTGTVMNPANWQTTQLSKDGEGRYYGSGPFAGPQPPTLWGLPVAVTPSIVANTALTGAYNSAAQVFRRGGVRVEASNSHSDFFIRNLTAIRAEKRLALAVYRPAAFGKITSLT